MADGKKKDRPQNKNLIPLTERSPEEAHALRVKGGKAAQAARQLRVQQNYLLGKYAGCPLVDKRTIAKFERMGFKDDDLSRALEITDAIFRGAKSGDPRMIEIYLRTLGEDMPKPPERNNNILDALGLQTQEDINTDDISEIRDAAEPDADVVEPSKVSDV